MLALQEILSVASGGLVGFSLGLIGGGGSILAVPLLVYVVGMTSPHHAIGTSAVAVAASAAFNLAGHARADTVKWRCALVFAGAGILGAALGAALGKAMDGQKLLALFGLLMLLVGGLMLRGRKGGDNPKVRLSWESARAMLPSLIAYGFAVGLLSGFFGIGGGFLVVPGLVGATAMPLLNAIGSSLVSVTAFGATTAVSYALTDLVDWKVAGLFELGGAMGGVLGIFLARRLANHKNMLGRIFAVVVIAVGAYVLAKGATAFFA
jgi:uncharacterized membrane protein YfcA